MSLFLGNLAPHIQREELERVFRRFGRSNVNLKDGYGFVVYDLPANAEKALRALKGKNICGEPISLTWSNKQPRPFQRFTKGSRSYEQYHRRNFIRRGGSDMRKMSLRDQRELKMVAKHLDSEGGGPHMDDLFINETVSHPDNIEDCKGEKNKNPKEGFLDEAVVVKQNSMENDRWGEPISETLNNNGIDFERYEPYHGYDRGDTDENHQMNSSYGSPQGSSQVEARRENASGTALKKSEHPKRRQTCYICGLIGHKMRNCSQADAYRQEKPCQFDRGREKDVSFRGRHEGRLKRLRPTPLGRPHSSGDLLTRRQKSHRKASGSGKHSTLVKRSECSPVREENFQHELRRKKKSKREQISPKKYRGWKARRSTSLTPSSDYTASRSRSHSPSSGNNSHSRSRSISHKPHSLSSSSTSISSSSYSRSDTSRSRSMSKSSSPTSLSLSVSLGQPLPSSPNKVPMEAAVTSPKGYLENGTCPKAMQNKQRQPVQEDASSENSRLKVTALPPKNQSTLPSFEVEFEMNKDRFSRCEDKGNDSMPKMQNEVKCPHTAPLGKCTLAAKNSPSENSRERMELQKSESLAMEQTQAPFGNSNPEVPVSSQTGNSSNISTQEMYMILKHYGLEAPEENADHLPVEAHFGSARFWPWEIIYYRRLKKGPISTENYARRVAQNREFGIVDKYIRSSSGWLECHEGNF